MGRFPVKFFTTWIVAFVLFLRRLLFNPTSEFFASLSERRIGEAGRCGRVSIYQARHALLFYFCLICNIVGGLLVKIRQYPRHYKKRRVVFHQRVFDLLSVLRGGWTFWFNLLIPFWCVDNRTTGHWNKALCCKVIHLVFETTPQLLYDIQKLAACKKYLFRGSLCVVLRRSLSFERRLYGSIPGFAVSPTSWWISVSNVKKKRKKRMKIKLFCYSLQRLRRGWV